MEVLLILEVLEVLRIVEVPEALVDASAVFMEPLSSRAFLFTACLFFLPFDWSVRLNAYWNKIGQEVHSCGIWVNNKQKTNSGVGGDGSSPLVCDGPAG